MPTASENAKPQNCQKCKSTVSRAQVPVFPFVRQVTSRPLGGGGCKPSKPWSLQCQAQQPLTTRGLNTIFYCEVDSVDLYADTT